MVLGSINTKNIPRTLIGAGGSSLPTNIVPYGAPYSASAFQKINGVCYLSGLFTSTAIINNDSIIYTLAAPCQSVFDAGVSRRTIGESTVSGNNPFRFCITPSGTI